VSAPDCNFCINFSFLRNIPTDTVIIIIIIIISRHLTAVATNQSCFRCCALLRDCCRLLTTTTLRTQSRHLVRFFIFFDVTKITNTPCPKKVTPKSSYLRLNLLVRLYDVCFIASLITTYCVSKSNTLCRLYFISVNKRIFAKLYFGMANEKTTVN